jgi:hypothetical protein
VHQGSHVREITSRELNRRGSRPRCRGGLGDVFSRDPMALGPFQRLLGDARRAVRMPSIGKPGGVEGAQ